MNGKSLTRKILKGLLLTGAIFVAASSPYFALNLSRGLWKTLGGRKPPYKDPRFKNTFYYLKRRGYLDIKKNNRQIYIHLTSEGRKMAGKYQIDDMNIKTPETWDKKWRVAIFDIPNNTNIKREAFRGKLKELGFCKIQQSVWVYPYDCKKEIDLLRSFFGLDSGQLRLITTLEIGEDTALRKIFNL